MDVEDDQARFSSLLQDNVHLREVGACACTLPLRGNRAGARIGLYAHLKKPDFADDSPDDSIDDSFDDSPIIGAVWAAPIAGGACAPPAPPSSRLPGAGSDFNQLAKVSTCGTHASNMWLLQPAPRRPFVRRREPVWSLESDRLADCAQQPE